MLLLAYYTDYTQQSSKHYVSYKAKVRRAEHMARNIRSNLAVASVMKTLITGKEYHATRKIAPAYFPL